ncbi:PREDICTED: DNA polymerase alpha subunit B [Eufriesea mexicana]|uniref:DNA polymerase alpha subunit B n=1 Tax=Eufriesea mexicana TaxID=516756 RepID=UPI00083BAC7B|nr:PREDICTED: DNA polymerase alpha subunit B [Eufriesea mexicana]
MVSEESLILCFSNLGCDVSDKFVIDKCIQICHAYNLDEDTFVEMWIAYAIPHSLNIDPTINDLIKFEREELRKNNTCSLEIPTRAVSNITIDVESKEEITNDVLDIYSTGESSTLYQIKRARSPAAETGNDNKLRAVDHTFTPSTYTSKPNTPIRAPSTTVRGKVLLSFGPDVQNWKKQDEYEVSIVKADNPHVPKDVTYMYEMLSKQGAVLSSRCVSFGERLCHIWNEMGPSNSNIRYVRNVMPMSQIPFRTWGRISITSNKSTGNKIVMLEGSKRCKGENNAPIIRLDLSGIKHYSVFPGQILAVEGINTAGDALIAKELFAKGYAPLFDTPKLTKDIKIYIAVGPFTPSDNLNYQPLWDLMECIVEEEPNILILIGPFVEYTHAEIKKNTLKDTYQDFFDKILAKILQYLQRKSTRIVLVPSNRDVYHDAVFPTPEFMININKLGPNVTNLYCMPDPCIINVDGLHIGITSVDALRHLGQKEVSNTSGMDRIGRLADHILSQATFYPLYPPFSGLNLDTTLWKKYACFERQPHVLILPSDIKHYCKSLNECLVLNPERLLKYTYAKLYVRPVNNGKWDPNKVSCEIAKV